MSSIRASAVPVCATALIAAAALASCAGEPRLSSQLPSGVRLAGDWKLDPAHSQDLASAVEELRAQQAKARHETAQGQQAQGQQQGSGGHGRRRSGGGQQGGEGGQGESSSGPEGGGDLGIGAVAPPRSSAVDELMSNVPQGDYLKIKVSASAFTVVSGDSTDEYTPGVESDISAVQGDAQQFTGWKGTDYLIDTRPQLGEEIIQTFSLTKDGTLSMTLRLSGNGIHFTFSRIYDRTTGVTPLAPPTIN
ncbi:MAG TPA: hypothetical protein VHY36_14125 [Steroidobacteraceae bacterium]|jgi:hypothetical protein|nr:hypothetical protein [Steroidobacteraceae bacterium]